MNISYFISNLLKRAFSSFKTRSTLLYTEKQAVAVAPWYENKLKNKI